MVLLVFVLLRVVRAFVGSFFFSLFDTIIPVVGSPVINKRIEKVISCH